jgi:TonB family protein
MVENHPEDTLAFSYLRPQGGPFNTAQDFLRVEAAWEQALAQHSDSPRVLVNAGHFFQLKDPERALGLYRQAQQLDPQDTHGVVRNSLAGIYVQAFLDTLTQKSNRLSKQRLLLNSDLATQLRNEIDSSPDAKLVSAVGTYLVQIGTRADSGLKDKGFELLQRAIDLDPTDPALKEALESAKAEPTRQRNYDALTHLQTPPGAVRIGSGVAEANLEKKIRPSYPPQALSARIQGTVAFEILIGTDGHVQKIELLRGHPLLVKAAKEALDQYTYKPTYLNGKPVQVITGVEIPFRIPQ